MRQQFVITAGLNKQERQLYVSSYDDTPTEWKISVVPYPTTKTRCYELLAQVKRDIKNKKDDSLLKRTPENIPFEIVEWTA